MNIKKICVVTGSRAEYGLLKPLITRLKKNTNFHLQLVVTGMHLSKKYGNTINEINNDNFTVYDKLDILAEENSTTYVGKTISKGIDKFSNFFVNNKPDILIVLGDRFEIFACCTAAYFLNIPIAHIHGGETTEGAFDEGIRHSITKMSYIHFTSTELYRNRVIQLGENPKNVFNVGALFLDAIRDSKILTKQELEMKKNIFFGDKNLLVTYHPETLSNKPQEQAFMSLINVLERREDINLIFTSPNADPGNNVIYDLTNDFIKRNSHRAIGFKSLGHLNYISALQYIDGVIGNSSSGITEAPAFNIGTVNIGDRQSGRIKGSSIIDCNADYDSIDSAIDKLYSKNFQKSLKLNQHPYGDGKTSRKIINILENFIIDGNIVKQFYDLKLKK
jgi:GDP/UDP-N,N'-diacetylbacillosamine 2-epimerase (hydrolysing)